MILVDVVDEKIVQHNQSILLIVHVEHLNEHIFELFATGDVARGTRTGNPIEREVNRVFVDLINLLHGLLSIESERTLQTEFERLSNILLA